MRELARAMAWRSRPDPLNLKVKPNNSHIWRYAKRQVAWQVDKGSGQWAKGVWTRNPAHAVARGAVADNDFFNESYFGVQLTRNQEKSNTNRSTKMVSKIEAFFETRFQASREAFGLDFGSILGLILEPRARHAIFYQNSTALQREHDF